MLLHDLLLRLPPRGGRRGRSLVAHRFAAWADGGMAALVRWWEADRAAVGCRSGASTRSAEERDVDRALFLISEGELGKGVSLLTSKGLADAGDPRIQAQLRSKHPARKGELPGSLDTLGAFVRVHVSLEDTIRGLSNHAGRGERIPQRVLEGAGH